MIKVCSCLCGSTDSLIRNCLKNNGYQDWMTIPIIKGKEKSRHLVASLPQFPEAQMLDHFLENASKWAVIIGWNENGMRWADIAHNGSQSRIEAEFIIGTFA